MWEQLPAAIALTFSRLEAAPTGKKISRAGHCARRSVRRHSGRPCFDKLI